MYYGIDIGGTKIEIAIFNEQLVPQDSWRIKTPVESYQSFIEALVTLIETADERYEIEGKIGLGMAGLTDRNNRSLSANIPVANGRNIAEDLSDKINRKVVLENDCRCFAISEANGGAGEGYSTVYGAIIGTGAAGGFVIDGGLLQSRQRVAGEYGHLQLPAFLAARYDLPLRGCGCGLPSCYEGYISGPGLSFLHKYFCGEDLKAPELISKWRAGDKNAEKTMDCYLDILGSCFSNLVLSYDPQVIVLGGGLSLVDEVVERLPANIDRHLFEGFRSPPVLRAKFGDASGARGAAINARMAGHA